MASTLQKTKILKTGGSYRITLPPAICSELGYAQGSEVDLIGEGPALMILPHRLLSQSEIENMFEGIRVLLEARERNLMQGK